MAYLAPLVRGFVSFVNRLTNATEPELGARLTAYARPLVRGFVRPFDGTDETRAGRPTTRDPGQDLQSPRTRYEPCNHLAWLACGPWRTPVMPGYNLSQHDMYPYPLSCNTGAAKGEGD